MFVYSHRQMLHSALIREATLYNDWQWMQKLRLLKELRIWDSWLPRSSWLHLHQPLYCSRMIREGGIERMWDPEDREKSCEMPSSGHNTTVTIMNSHLQLSTLDLHKTVNSQSWMGKNLMGPYPSLMNYWRLMNSGKGGVTIFKSVPIGELTGLHWIVTRGHSCSPN